MKKNDIDEAVVRKHKLYANLINQQLPVLIRPA